MKKHLLALACQRIATAAGVGFLMWGAGAPYSYGQINKCLDASGKVVGYATFCPEGTQAERLGIRDTPATSAAPSAEKSLAEQDAEFRKRQIEEQQAQAKAAQQKAAQEERAEACDSARSYLKTLQSGARIMRTDPNTGERSYLTDAEYPAEIAKAQRAVDANCK